MSQDSKTTYEYASYKRIILCADGTWTSSDSGNASVPSNVARIARAIANNGQVEIADGGSKKKQLVKQIVYYGAGLGSTDSGLEKWSSGKHRYSDFPFSSITGG
jgi:uncharacterized protein (DUF2235 family)